MELNQALSIANQIVDNLKDTCEKIEIAGSMRREREFVKDIEIVCLPKMEEVLVDMFNIKPVRYNQFITNIKSIGKILSGCPYTGRMLKIEHPEEIKIDLFIPQEHDFYRQFAIRTGSADYSWKVIAKGWRQQGWVGTEDGLRIINECYQLNEKKWVCKAQTPTLPPIWQSEKEFFEFIKVAYIEPKYRS